MVTRKRKLVAAGVVLFVGAGAALVFPREDAAPVDERSAAGSPAVRAAVAAEGMGPTPTIASEAGRLGEAGLRVSAVVDRRDQSPSPVTRPSDHLTAIAASQPPSSTVDPTTHAARLGPAASSGRPVYLPGVSPPEDEKSTSPYASHVVHNGDTLKRLAQRYLKDDTRALELFDLNRDVLENPHVLPIGVELRIPRVGDSME